jgi:hypothetical protein
MDALDAIPSALHSIIGRNLPARQDIDAGRQSEYGKVCPPIPDGRRVSGKLRKLVYGSTKWPFE